MLKKDLKDKGIDPNAIELLKKVIKALKQSHNLTINDLIRLYNSVGKKESTVPLSVFSGKLSPSESLCKYMKENLKMNYREIAINLNRDERSIWTSYNRAIKKSKDSLLLISEYPIPISIFKDRKFAILESLALYLIEEYSLKSSQIAKLLNKSSPLVYTVLKRARVKQNE